MLDSADSNFQLRGGAPYYGEQPPNAGYKPALSSKNWMCWFGDCQVSYDIIADLIEQGEIPESFLERIEYIEWEGDFKDLQFISEAEPSKILIIDDDECYIVPDQKKQWIEICPYDPTGVNPWLPMKSQNAL